MRVTGWMLPWHPLNLFRSSKCSRSPPSHTGNTLFILLAPGCYFVYCSYYRLPGQKQRTSNKLIIEGCIWQRWFPKFRNCVHACAFSKERGLSTRKKGTSVPNSRREDPEQPAWCPLAVSTPPSLAEGPMIRTPQFGPNYSWSHIQISSAHCHPDEKKYKQENPSLRPAWDNF